MDIAASAVFYSVIQPNFLTETAGRRRVGIGIIGTGAMAAAHASAYAEIPEVEIVGVCGRSADRTRAIAALCNAEALTDAGALLRDAAVEAIDMCLPTELHSAYVIPALDQGKHVFCETPLALHLEDAHRMLTAARRNKRLLQVGLLMRATAAYAHVKDVAESGESGRLLSLTTYRLGSYLLPGLPDRKTHYGEPSTELMTFDFDFVQWLMGRPERLSASATRGADGNPGETTALLTYRDGRHAAILASGLMPGGFPFSVGFRAVFERAAFILQNTFEGGPPRSDFKVYADGKRGMAVPVEPRNPYVEELRHFADCVRGRADCEKFDAERAIEALVLSAATQRSLSEGRTIDLD